MCGVPTDLRRKKERGFDLPEELFAAAARERGIQWTNCLERIRPTHHLFDLTPQERRKNLRGSFAVTQNVSGRKIILADDIFTTGATLQECARVLLAAGACEVAGLTFCSSPLNYAAMVID